MRRSTGAQGASGTGRGPGAASPASGAGLAGHDSNGAKRLLAFISPSETPLRSRWLWPNKLNYQTDFLEFPRPHHAMWSAKMALEEMDVNLWETREVP